MKKIKLNKVFWIILLLLVLIMIGVILLFKKGSNPLVGTWTTDGVTVYRFDRGGKGALIVPVAEYEFTYEIDDDKVYIDFKNKKSRDSDYEFSFKNDKLILKGINKTTGTYTFKKYVENEKK